MPIAEFIREQGFRFDYLAARLGITSSHFSRVVRSERITVKRIYELAAVMRLPVRDVAAAAIPEINVKEKSDASRSSAQTATRRNRCAAANSAERADT